MTPLLIFLVGCVYCYIAVENLYLGNIGVAIMYFGYTLGNVGLFIMAETNNKWTAL